MEALEQQILELIARAYDAIGWPGVVVLMTIESVFFPIPSEAVMPLAGWMLIEAQGHSVWFVLLAGLFGALGSLIGAIAIYAIGLFGGRPLLEKYGRYVLISRNDLDVADRWFERYGTWAVFIAQTSPRGPQSDQSSRRNRQDAPTPVPSPHLPGVVHLVYGPRPWWLFAGIKLGSVCGTICVHSISPSLHYWLFLYWCTFTGG